ncbi:B12-binding domain-containing radical SAM protein [Clostridium zeae]|uniref:B12-binding domain-containing radical SAM protein n=1 Tax=Clostridium zeae TaxID=2759022 RepID=A0ABQ1E823_9CLOT|nr:radical SAM protein [Clostridium zeae]GFZ30881.1 B12-binding domain-containing radical SAM protein [Clostridium zeae]
MKVLLIMPTVHKEGIERVKPFWLPPLGLATIASYIPNDVDVEIIDENIKDIDFNINVDLVGISCMTSQANRAYDIAREFRKRNVTVVIGGYHPSSLPEEAAKHVDAVMVGEGEGIWERLINDFKNNDVKKYYRHEDGFPVLCELPRPRRDLLADGYQMINTIQTARGCPYACEFCNVSTFFGRQYRVKPIDEIVAEVKEMKEKYGDMFFFVDDEITANPKRSIELFKALTPLKIHWWSQATLRNMTSNPDVIKYAKDSGCFIMVVGLETINEKNMEKMNKAHNSIASYEEQIAMIQENGIYLNPSFTFGHDNDTAETFENVHKFINRNNIAMATFNILTPLPNTKFYNRLMEENRIFEHDWSKYNMGNCVFNPKSMSAQELDRCFQEFCRKFYSIHEIGIRVSKVRKEDRGLLYGFNLGYKKMLDKFGVIM